MAPNITPACSCGTLVWLEPKHRHIVVVLLLRPTPFIQPGAIMKLNTSTQHISTHLNTTSHSPRLGLTRSTCWRTDALRSRTVPGCVDGEASGWHVSRTSSVTVYSQLRGTTPPPPGPTEQTHSSSESHAFMCGVCSMCDCCFKLAITTWPCCVKAPFRFPEEITHHFDDINY